MRFTKPNVYRVCFELLIALAKAVQSPKRSFTEAEWAEWEEKIRLTKPGRRDRYVLSDYNKARKEFNGAEDD